MMFENMKHFLLYLTLRLKFYIFFKYFSSDLSFQRWVLSLIILGKIETLHKVRASKCSLESIIFYHQVAVQAKTKFLIKYEEKLQTLDTAFKSHDL